MVLCIEKVHAVHSEVDEIHDLHVGLQEEVHSFETHSKGM